MNPRHRFVAQRALHHCEYCKAPEAIFNFPFEVEHITPPGNGGTNSDENLALACRSCNLYKSDFILFQDPFISGYCAAFPSTHRPLARPFCLQLGVGINRRLDTDWKSNSCLLASEFRSPAVCKASMGSTRALSVKGENMGTRWETWDTTLLCAVSIS